MPEAPGSSHRRRLKSINDLNADAFEKLKSAAASYAPKPKKAAPDRTREREIIDLLLKQGASVEAAVRFCRENGVSVSAKFARERRKELAAGSAGSPASPPNPPQPPVKTTGKTGTSGGGGSFED